MKATILVESLTGNTWKAGESIASLLALEGWQVTGLSPVKAPDHAAIQAADVVVVGTWVHGLFVVGQAPWGTEKLRALPSMTGKKVAAFCTYALNPGRSLATMTAALAATGAEVVGGLTIQRGRIAAHTEEFVARLSGALASA